MNACSLISDSKLSGSGQTIMDAVFSVVHHEDQVVVLVGCGPFNILASGETDEDVHYWLAVVEELADQLYPKSVVLSVQGADSRALVTKNVVKARLSELGLDVQISVSSGYDGPR